jgi:hypothetical protein
MPGSRHALVIARDPPPTGAPVSQRPVRPPRSVRETGTDDPPPSPVEGICRGTCTPRSSGRPVRLPVSNSTESLTIPDRAGRMPATCPRASACSTAFRTWSDGDLRPPNVGPACGWAGSAGSRPADGPGRQGVGLRMGRVGRVWACGCAGSARRRDLGAHPHRRRPLRPRCAPAHQDPVRAGAVRARWQRERRPADGAAGEPHQDPGLHAVRDARGRRRGSQRRPAPVRSHQHGLGYELTAIAAVVIGGTLSRAGRARSPVRRPGCCCWPSSRT